MSVQENKAIVKRFNEENDYSVIEQLITPDFKGHAPNVKGGETWEDNMKAFYELNSAFPDMHFSYEDLIGEGDFVAMRWHVHGTFKGSYMGVKPTGKPVDASGVTLFRLANGKIREVWNSWDRLDLLQQIGAVPELAASAV